MKIMVGIDLHNNNALCGLMDETGRRLIHKKLPCDLAAPSQRLCMGSWTYTANLIYEKRAQRKRINSED